MRPGRIIFFLAFLIIQSLPGVKECCASEAGRSDFFTEAGLPAEQYINYGLELLYRGDYKGCIKMCENALYSDTGNARALNAVAIAYARERDWENSILYGEKALRAKPDYTEAYINLGKAYLETGRWEKAVEATSKTLELYPSQAAVINDYNRARIGLQNVHFSRVLIPVFFLLLAGFFFLFYYKNKSGAIPPAETWLTTLEVFLSSGAVFFILYQLFFYAAPVARSMHTKIPFSDITSFMRHPTSEHDGKESMVLYALLITGIFMSLVVTWLIERLKRRTTFYSLLFVFAVMSFAYFMSTGFYPAWSDPSPTLKNYFLLVALFFAVGCVLFFAGKYGKRTSLVAAGIILLPVCFVATVPISIWDYSFVLAPAMRLSEGIAPSEIFFQYDLLLSLIGWLWLKLSLDVYSLQYAGTFSMYVFLLAIFLFAQKVFANKYLPVLLLVFVVIVRIYSHMFDPAAVFGGTSLRLDLWLVLLFLVFWKDARHWSVGLTLALLILFHKNFGIIYLAAYIQLLFVLFLLELAAKGKNENLLTYFFQTLKRQFFLSFRNLLLVSGGIIASILLFKEFTPESVRLYLGLGISQLPVSKTSFYWYIPVLLSCVLIVLFKYRAAVSRKYFETGIFLVLLCIGNSIYFFGRSHEHNIINISGSLALALFMFFDVLDIRINVEMKGNVESRRAGSEYRFKRVLIYLLPVLFILSATYYYGNRVSTKLKKQFANLKKGQIVYPPSPPLPSVFGTIRELTANDRKVYFLDFRRDFVHYYYGGYTPLGYFSPCTSWVIKKDFAAFLQQLLDHHYYLVTSEITYTRDLLPLLSFNRVADKNGYTAISKKKTEPLLNSGKSSVLHLSIPDKIGITGIAHKPISAENQFAIRCVLNPSSEQITDATIVSNTRETLGKRGLVIQQNDTSTNEYFFAYGDKINWVKSAPFRLKPGKWNYLVVMVNGSEIKIYINGSVVSVTSVNSSISNSDLPFIVGARETFREMSGITPYEPQVSTDRPFNGLIREVEISNSYFEEKVIGAEWQRMEQKISVEANERNR